MISVDFYVNTECFARYPKYLNCVMKLPESLKAFRKVLSIEIRTYH